MASLDEDELTSTMVTVDVLINELVQADRERWTTICMEYTDLYLNSYYILSMRARIPKVRDVLSARKFFIKQSVACALDGHPWVNALSYHRAYCPP